MAECDSAECKVLPRQVKRGIESGLQQLMPEQQEKLEVECVYPVLDGDQDLDGEDVDEDLDSQEP
eukprot:5931803-Amphidinium_carterae.3